METEKLLGLSGPLRDFYNALASTVGAPYSVSLRHGRMTIEAANAFAAQGVLALDEVNALRKLAGMSPLANSRLNLPEFPQVEGLAQSFADGRAMIVQVVLPSRGKEVLSLDNKALDWAKVTKGLLKSHKLVKRPASVWMGIFITNPVVSNEEIPVGNPG